MFGWIWVGNPAADKGGGEKTDKRLSGGGTQRTRLIGFARRLTAIEATKEVAANCGRPVKARAGGVVLLKGIMSYEPFIQLLVVTLRAAWFNFRGWNKRR
jgi:hypothetical protein